MIIQSFKDYLNIAIPEYADDKITAGTWKKSEAIPLAKESYIKLLSDEKNGLRRNRYNNGTKNQRLKHYKQ